ncbi:MAG TPA: cobyrinate a,c-diamide synthase [Candidatus Avacidaminococcus intestinavium]|uniref:Cobyrinate a,c-diamide synthase n=1 Tax=Candidatus Avacidaminococcus intestinavium TaxID=2840684 RepID=A0A9D1MRH2_9FIRM|nr:cobyrinate a,c-diamide synthase [Candidatus Avacidaminococcus intestinavium]
MIKNVPRIMFTAPNSSSGKTTVTCAVLQALINQQFCPTAFKSGPDYIDPMFHSKILGTKSRNLDLFLLGADTCRQLLAKNAAGSDIAILEGAMGYYDGIGTTDCGSAYELAKETATPVILVLNAKGAALSAAAMIKGFCDFRKDSNIQGVILNNINPMTYHYYKETIETETGIKLLGYLPQMKDCSFESRHLGLVTAEEIKDLQNIVTSLAQQAAKSIDLEGLRKIAEQAKPLSYEEQKVSKIADVKIAIAQDKAFCFYYQDALELLEDLGAKLVPFSPLNDKAVPSCDGIILGGGYPEVYAGELASNTEMLRSIKTLLKENKPCLAECGGFMYLLERYIDATGSSFTWVGALAGEVSMTKSLQRFGYVTLTAKHDNLLATCGESINAHEFHYSDSTANGNSYLACKASLKGQWECINATATLYAGYPHIHLCGNSEFAKNFVKACAEKRTNS